MYLFPQYNSPRASHPFLLMLLWTPNACSDVSKCQISITTLMTHDFYNAPNVFPQFNAPQSHRHKDSLFSNVPMDSK